VRDGDRYVSDRMQDKIVEPIRRLIFEFFRSEGIPYATN
jgi:hypothetical protein